MKDFIKEQTEEEMAVRAERVQNSRVNTFPVINANNGFEDAMREIIIADSSSISCDAVYCTSISAINKKHNALYKFIAIAKDESFFVYTRGGVMYERGVEEFAEKFDIIDNEDAAKFINMCKDKVVGFSRGLDATYAVFENGTKIAVSFGIKCDQYSPDKGEWKRFFS